MDGTTKKPPRIGSIRSGRCVLQASYSRCTGPEEPTKDTRASTPTVIEMLVMALPSFDRSGQSTFGRPVLRQVIDERLLLSRLCADRVES
jgi:hypothetical protein